MSNHFSADYLKSPGDDRRLDITDVFVFKSSKDGGKMLLIVNSNPTAPAPKPVQARGPEFYPGAVYKINVDTDGDAHADVAFTFTFSDYAGGTQTGTCWYATGAQAREPGRAGGAPRGEVPGSLRGLAPAPPGRPDPAAGRAAQRPVLRRRRGHPARLRLDRPRRLRRQQRQLPGAGGPRRHAVHRTADRRLGLDQPPPPRRHPGTNGPRREPDAQPVHQPRRGEKPVQLPPARRRRGQLPGAVVQGPAERRLPARTGPGGRPAGTARHPALRPHQAPLLPQRPQAHRGHLQLPLRLAELRENPPPRPQTPPRPAHRLPLPRPAQPLAERNSPGSGVWAPTAIPMPYSATSQP